MAEDHFEVVTIETDQPGRLANITNTRQVTLRTHLILSSRRIVMFCCSGMSM